MFNDAALSDDQMAALERAGEAGVGVLDAADAAGVPVRRLRGWLACELDDPDCKLQHPAAHQAHAAARRYRLMRGLASIDAVLDAPGIERRRAIRARARTRDLHEHEARLRAELSLYLCPNCARRETEEALTQAFDRAVGLRRLDCVERDLEGRWADEERKADRAEAQAVVAAWMQFGFNLD